MLTLHPFFCTTVKNKLSVLSDLIDFQTEELLSWQENKYSLSTNLNFIFLLYDRIQHCNLQRKSNFYR